MRFTQSNSILRAAFWAVTALLAGSSVSVAQQVNLTAAPGNAILPDGQSVPMWGYSCDVSPAPTLGATCVALNPNAAGGWSPVLITVPAAGSGASLTIHLTNGLPATLPTSITIVGTLGGGLVGGPRTPDATPSPAHAPQGATWPIAGDTSGATLNPPVQANRVQSFGTRVDNGTSADLNWTGLQPGTYLIESGTHPSIQGPMGLYGVLVVTTPAGTSAGTAYTNIKYNAEVVALLSEIDPSQNRAVASAVGTTGFSETSIRVLRDSVSSVVVNAGGTNFAQNDAVVFSDGGVNDPLKQAAGHVDTVDSTTGAIVSITIDNPGSGYSSAPKVAVSSAGTGADLSAALSLSGTMCSNGAAACYPPAVNYDPRYYLINGASFDRTKPGNSLLAASPAATGDVLVRLVNAGLRMHIPSIVGAQTTNGASTTTPGFSLIAEDAHVLPEVALGAAKNPPILSARVQSEVFLAAGKVYDVMVNSSAAATLPLFDRQLSLSANNQRDGGMLAYIGVAGGVATPTAVSAHANDDNFVLVPGNTLTISDSARGVIANDVGVYGVTVLTGNTCGASGTDPCGGNATSTLTLHPDGTFEYTPGSAVTNDTFYYFANGNSSLIAKVTLADCGATAGCMGGAPTANADGFMSSIASRIEISVPGVLGNDTDPDGHPLQAVALATGCVAPATGFTLLDATDASKVQLHADGSFAATPGASGNYYFCYQAVNSQKTASNVTSVALNMQAGTGLKVHVYDAPDYVKNPSAAREMTDYRWIIEEDRTIQVDPACQTASPSRPSTCPPLPVPSVGTNFHTSHMPVVASGCVGPLSCQKGQTLLHQAAVCDVGNGACRTDASQLVETVPSDVALDPHKRYYITILPGDGANPFISGAGPGPVDDGTGPRPFDITKDCGPFDPNGAAWAPGTGTCGHTMGGAPISAGQTAVNVLIEESPLPTATISVFVFEDDFPLNGEVDSGGGVDVLAPNEPGLGGFALTVFDQAGQFGDSTGQLTYDMFNYPVSNALAGTKDPATGFDACPISPSSTDGLVGMIITCPKFEAGNDSSGNPVRSPLAGQAIIRNLYAGLYEVVANPGADRLAKGEEWLQTNTLDGTKPLEAFIRPGEPSYFQEFGPGGFHVSIGFANPKIINDRLALECANQVCGNTVKGHVTLARISRTPDERLYSSENYAAYAYTQCYVTLGDPDGEDISFQKCDENGNFSFSGIPDGSWRVTVFDQWNDLLVDGLSTPASVKGGATTDIGDVAIQQWRTNLSTKTYFDTNKDGVFEEGESGLTLVPVNIRYRDGSFANFNNTDLEGNAGFNEVFPYFNWLVAETDTTRYKQTGVHVVYDAGGPADGTVVPGAPRGSSGVLDHIANTFESPTAHLPPYLRVPGAVYCDNADCSGFSIKPGDPGNVSADNPSTGRIDPPWISTEAWQGFIGQTEYIEFGKKPFNDGENGGIQGHVIYASTRPFDDPALLLQLSWEPGVPNVTVNLYQKGTALDGTDTLKLVDTTTTSSWDDWAQGFRKDANGNLITDPGTGNHIPNMNCPGQETGDPFYFTIKDSTNWLTSSTALPEHAQFKCYDGLHAFNQVQPAPYDGKYEFPSVTARDANGKPAVGATHCTICKANTAADTNDWNYNLPMLPPGKYVVEVVVPQGYELVKEEDKNILIGDNYIAPVTVQFNGLGSIFILPDQAAVASTSNSNNPQNPTTDLGATPRHEGDTGSVEAFWACVGQERIVPDFISLFPGSAEVSPFAGATRRLCDRKEVTLEDQMTVLAKFYVFTDTHIAGKYSGIITDDYSSEFDPFSPSFGEKFAVPNLPISFKDYNGVELARTYSDQWGQFNGLNYSTWEVNTPNPTGYGPTMMVTCMNDPGPYRDSTGAMVMDPLYNPGYSNFCYETPFMPGNTQYMDTPVIPTMAFAEGYNPPDCAYPDGTPAILRVDGNTAGGGPYVDQSAGALQITIKSLGDVQVPDNRYTGPQATDPRFSNKFVTRHYGFGATRGTLQLVRGNTTVTLSTIPVGNNGNTWSDDTIVATIPSTALNAFTGPVCAAPGGLGPTSPPLSAPLPVLSTAPKLPWTSYCGELVITTSTGKKSIDSVTLTIENTRANAKAPTYVTAENSSNNALQQAIDAAAPGDLIIVGPPKGSTTPITFNEMLIMWKPVRLQGVSATLATINANPHPAGKLDPWRAQVLCLFGLAQNGQPINGNNTSASCDSKMQFQVDRVPLEGILGWDTTTNGNLAELLQEPTLMGAYEGAGITVLGKGVRYPVGSDPFGSGAESAFPAGTLFLDGFSSGILGATPDCNPSSGTYFVGNFLCAQSRIDGLTINNSSQGGGGIFLHGWNHYLEISNNRIHGNSGTLTGGITVGQGEFSDPIITGDDDFVGTNVPARLPLLGAPTGTQLPYLLQVGVNVHHNSVTQNASYGDELFSATPAGAGGVTFCTGSDYYHFNYNWICGNLSTGDGGGVSHLGFSYNADISRNSILFNQSQNPTIPTQGGGLVLMGAAPDGFVNGTECGTVTDVDCQPGLSDGIGPSAMVDSNLIMGNTAESGSGGGIRLQTVNGAEVARFTGSSNNSGPNNWYKVTVQNNIIANNVAGWDGGGLSMQDALRVDVINNTFFHNDTTASAGVLFNTLGAPLASVPGQGCDPVTGFGCLGSVSTSTQQAAGLVTMQHTPNMIQSLPNSLTCPTSTVSAASPYSGSGSAATCRKVSLPVLANNVFWQNRAFHLEVDPNVDPIHQQHLVTLNPPLNQGTTGECVTSTNFWDIGVRGDTGPSSHSSGFLLNPVYSVLTDANDYPGKSNLGLDPLVARAYCNGSRTPPESGMHGYDVPPGIADATVPNPLFSLSPSATVDEGNNWINMSYGPLTLINLSGLTLGQYVPRDASSPTVDAVPNSSGSTYPLAPTQDFFGNNRKSGTCSNAVDMGAVEFQGATGAAQLSVSPLSLAFPNTAVNVASATQNITITNCGSGTLTVNQPSFPTGFRRSTATGQGGSCPTTATFTAPTAGCTIGVQFAPTSAVAYSATLPITGGGKTVNVSLTGNAGPTANASPSLLEFGPVATNTTSSNFLTVTLSNTGIGSLSITGLTFTDAFHRTTGGTQCSTTLPITITQGNSCSVRVRFTPTQAIYYSGSLTIATSDAAHSTLTVGLTGTGTPGAIESVSGPLSFGSQLTGSSSAIQAVTVSNDPSAIGNLIITGIALTGGNASQYSIVTPTAAQLAGTFQCNTNNPNTFTVLPGKKCVIGVQFHPTSSGSKGGNLRVTFADPVAPSGTANIGLSGTGVNPLTITAPSPLLNTGGVSLKNGVITVTNVLTVPLTVSAVPTIVKTGGNGNPGTFSITGGTCASGLILTTTGAASHCTINVQYNPHGSTGNSTGHVTVSYTSTAGNGSQNSSNFVGN